MDTLIETVTGYVRQRLTETTRWGVTERLDRQIAFLLEADRLKTILRAQPIADGSRRENSGEHSWHLALFALVLPTRPGGVDIDRVIRMLLSTIWSRSTPATPDPRRHDRAAQETAERAAADRSRAAARRPGRRLPRPLGRFEAGDSADARFARALDRVQPPLLNAAAGGAAWHAHGVTLEHIDARVAPPPAAARPPSGPMSAPESRLFSQACDPLAHVSFDTFRRPRAMLQVQIRSSPDEFFSCARPNPRRKPPILLRESHRNCNSWTPPSQLACQRTI